ncbi:MAG: peptidoglycan DD-metalloendopeptidase family protein [Alphaproteobacteria bacterium]|nr:peptidoglycan DD-metalloendopeptidase family protein [Alphaproteobacteria bacterium]MBU6471121.1 peptidoglycan DD-metalloendopeptidase family protein [Alphaproteobacteria bacterium]MDE2011706.1 peptidoglycan DD-metalloendopeptidase family protein [Alphaproteobacteria bacterium]MDE2074324.1 peptidoglycan DD-metalloendopeptidase family protein [Alphaproteobacteria bacterium]MDE2353127.1 peptidoglycan DD-metalloendopeptidase family protein [Alphaproteobacteria bacterium]
MERRDSSSLQSYLSQWRQTAFANSVLVDTADSRWAFVSTSVTLFVAGSIAWLAAGAVPPAAPHGYRTNAERTLLPYQLFMRLTSQGAAAKTSYAAIGPAAALAITRPAVTGQPPAALDDVLADNAADQSGDTPDNSTRTITMDSGDTLVGALTDAGVASSDANAVVMALRKVYDPRAIRAGQSFDVSFAPAVQHPVARIIYTSPSDGDAGSSGADQTSAGRLISVSFSPAIEHQITVTRATDGSFTAQDVKTDLVAHYHRAGARIDSSLYLAAMQAGIPADIVVQMIHVLSYQVDFQRDIRPGNSFELLYSYYYTPDGKPAKQGVIDYVTMKLGGRTVTLYRYTAKDGSVDYLDAQGRSAKALLMRTPVDGARISSGFGMRFHPVLGYTRMHKGVDFAVPVGTPVMAAGNGTIRFEGRENGYGNFLLIQNNSEYSTAYGHLSRFVRGLHVGSHVHQGEVVAYSGNTGLTTGPHLHYEVRIDGKQVNPLTVKIATGVQLKGKPLQAYLVQRLHIDQELAAMPLETKIADNSAAGLRTNND